MRPRPPEPLLRHHWALLATCGHTAQGVRRVEAVCVCIAVIQGVPWSQNHGRGIDLRVLILRVSDLISLFSCRTARSPLTSTPSPWPPAPASTTTCARSRGRTAPPPPSPSRTLTSRLSIAPATNRDAGRTPLIQCFVSYSLHCEGGSGAKA